MGPISTHRSCLNVETVCQRGGPYQVVGLVGVENNWLIRDTPY